MRGSWWALGLVAALGCRSDQGLGVDVPDFGPPNAQIFETPLQTDRIVQLTVPRVDALFVVDNSCSMDEEQVLLAANFPVFLDWFRDSGLDYHIGVVSTDMVDPLESGRLRVAQERRWIDDRVRDPDVLFAQMTVMGTDGYWLEKGRAAAYTAIELLRSEDNLGFVRGDAAMHITVVSDENDDSGESPIGREEFIQWLRSYRTSRQMVSFSSIVGPVAGCADIGSPGTEYTDVTAEVGGVVWPICDPDWSQVLDELGFLAVGLEREFYLSARPEPGTIEVSVELENDAVQVFAPKDWTYDEVRNSITFVDFVPDPLTTVVLTYRVRSEDQDGVDVEGPTNE
jgi:hypothetical protein